MNIFKKDGEQINVAIENVGKVTFKTDQATALLISAKDSSETGAALTDISRIAFGDQTTHAGSAEFVTQYLNRTFVLRQNYPNPFNPATTIEYEIPIPGWVDIRIYNLNGQLVKTLKSGYSQSGVHTVIWSGEDDNQHRVSGGVYFFEMRYNNFVQTKKLLYMP
jgi:hypothetical protein